MNLSFPTPESFDETHADKLFKGLASRFRFSGIKLSQLEFNVTITFDVGNNKDMPNRISDYVNGFFAAI